MVDRLERLTDLIALLLHTREPLTFAQIRWALGEGDAGYDDGESGRRSFERDKETLRNEGIEITVEHPEGEQGAAAYRIRPEDYELGDLGLDDPERVALNLAVSAVRLEGTTWGLRAGWKLGEPEGDHAPLAALPGLDLLPDLADAAGSGGRVGFGYRGARRRLDVWSLLQRDGFWYVSGHDVDADGLRNFRVDRIDAGTLDRLGDREVDPPAGYDAGEALTPDPKLMGDGPTVVATVAVDPIHAERVRRSLGGPEPLGTADDGWVLLPVRVANGPAFRSWLLGLLDRARVEGPDDLRAEVVDWLTRLAAPAR